MAVKLANRVSETAGATGTGAFTLQGVSEAQYRAFSSAFQTGDKVVYTAVQGEIWEVGYGTLTSSTSLTRDVVWDSSASSGYINSGSPGTPVKVSFTGGTSITTFNAVTANIVLAVDENGQLIDGSPFRATIFIETLADMRALDGLSDGETVIVTEEGVGGIFVWDASDAGTADDVDSFANDNYGTGLHKRVRLQVNGDFVAALTVDAATGGDSYMDFFTAKKASNSTKFFRWLTDAANSAFTLAARLNQSSVVPFLTMFSLGTNADRFAFLKPFVMPTKANAQGLKDNTFYLDTTDDEIQAVITDASDNTTAADRLTVPRVKGTYLLGTYELISDLKAIDAAKYAKTNQRALVLGSADGGDIEPFYVEWFPSSSATNDDCVTFRPSTGAAATGNGRWVRVAADQSATFTSGDATPSVKGHSYFTTAGTTTITAFDDKYENQEFDVVWGGADITIAHDPAKIDLNGFDQTLTTTNRRLRFRSVGGVAKCVNMGAVPDLTNTTNAYLLIDRVVTISADTTITKMVYVIGGGGFTVNSGKVLTINGGINADCSAIFSGAGSVRFGPKTKEVWAEWFGAVPGIRPEDITGGNTRDLESAARLTSGEATANSAAINKAITSVYAGGGTVRLAAGNYWVDGSTPIVHNKANVKVKGDGGDSTWLTDCRAGTRTYLFGDQTLSGLTNHMGISGITIWRGKDPTGSDAQTGSCGISVMGVANPIFRDVISFDHCCDWYLKGTTGVTFDIGCQALRATAPSVSFFGLFLDCNGTAIAGTSMNGSLSARRFLTHANAYSDAGGTESYALIIDASASDGDCRDLFFDGFEASRCTRGPWVIGNASASLQTDIHFTKSIIDSAYVFAFKAEDLGPNAQLTIDGGWFSITGSGSDAKGLWFDSCYNFIVDGGVQVNGTSNYANVTGILANDCHQFVIGSMSLQDCAFGQIVNGGSVGVVKTANHGNYSGRTGTTRTLLTGNPDNITIEAQNLGGASTNGVVISSGSTNIKVARPNHVSGTTTPFTNSAGANARLTDRAALVSSGQGAISGAITLTALNVGQHLVCTASGFTVTMPSAAAAGNGGAIMIKNLGTNGSNVTIALAGADSSDLPTNLLAPDQVLWIMSDGGTFWRKILLQ